jgi:hypothetical protein
MVERQPTVRRNEAKRQADKMRGRDFSALESFVNLDLKVFLKMHSDYVPFAKADDGTAEMMNWYREQLSKVWAGQDPANVRLMILLGIKKTPDWKPWRAFLGNELAAEAEPPAEIRLDPTFAVDALSWTEIVRKLQAPSEEPQFFEVDGHTGADHIDPIAFESFGLPEAELVFDWKRSSIFPEFKTKLQSAIYALMTQSWRAKVCRNCREYFVAAKTAQVHCSHECYVNIKNARSLHYWNTKGKAERARKRKKG